MSDNQVRYIADAVVVVTIVLFLVYVIVRMTSPCPVSP